MSTAHKKEFKKLVEQIKIALRKEGSPGRYEDIAKKMGYDRSYFSTLMGSRGVVTEDHIKLLKLHFPFLEKQKNGEDLESLIKTLIVKLDKLIELKLKEK